MKRFLWVSFSILGTSLFAHNAGNNATSLDSAIADANVGTSLDFTVNFDQPVVSLGTQVRALNSDGTFVFLGNTINVIGNNRTLDGTSTVRGLFVGGESSSSTGSVTISELDFSNCRAKGGDGQTGGGGGLGAGGGLFVGKNAVAVIENCSFSNCTAMGGNSPSGVGGGGGGMHGDGGTGSATFDKGGAGGFGGVGANGSFSGGGGGGASDFGIGDASGTTPGNNFQGGGAPGTSGVGGKGQMAHAADSEGGFGGGGAGALFSAGGNGGDYAGGGGGQQGNSTANRSNGGFGGGGGQGNTNALSSNGGFGAGGANQNLGGFGGGDGDGSNTGFGGRGAGFGGAIFLQDGSQLTIKDSINFSGNSASSGTTGNSNTDPLAGSGALGQDIFMMSSSHLIFNLTSPGSIPSPIEGDQGGGGGSTTTNGLNKQGSALLGLTGDNTYTGQTVVEAGELRINGSVVTDTIVNFGATLSGNFSIKQNFPKTNNGNLQNSGLVSPGVGGVGTINIEGDFSQTGTGTLLVDITPTGNVNDKLFVTAGNSTLAGTIDAFANTGNYIAGTTYEVILGPSSNFFNTELLSGPEASNIAISVDYNVGGAGVLITILTDRLFEDQVIDSGIPSEVVKCILASEPIQPGSDFADIVEILGTLSNQEVNRALITLSPVQFGSLDWINARNNSLVADVLSNHLFELCCSPRGCSCCCCNTQVWISGYGNWMDNRKSFDNLSPFDASAGGVTLGLDHYFPCPELFIGIAAGYTHTDFDWEKHRGKGKINSYYGAVYGSWQPSCFAIDFSAIGGGSDYSMRRKIAFGSVNRTAKSDPWGQFFTGRLGLHGNWDYCCITFEPYVLADYHYFHRNSFKEHGADSLNLKVKSFDQHIIRPEAGLLFYYTYEYDCFCLAPYLGVSWVGEFPLSDSDQKASFQGQSCIMDVESYDSSIQYVSPQAGFKWTSDCGFSILIGYKGLYNHKVRLNQVEGRLEYIF